MHLCVSCNSDSKQYCTTMDHGYSLFSDGSEVYKGRHHRLPLRITEVGSDQTMSTSPQYLQVQMQFILRNG